MVQPARRAHTGVVANTGGSRHRSRSVAGGLVAALLAVTACSAGGETGRADGGEAGGDGSDGADVAVPDDLGLSGDGVELVGDLAAEAPRYRLTAQIDPERGRLDGQVEADLPVGADAEAVHLRYFPGLVDQSATIERVTVDGEPVEAETDVSLVTVPLDGDHGDRVSLTAWFAYEIPEMPEPDPLGGLGDMLGEGLQPEEVGLMGRGDGVVTLGHWYPVWIPGGASAEPDPEGFGDIGNFPAAVMHVEADVPEGWTLATGGVGVESSSPQTDRDEGENSRDADAGGDGDQNVIVEGATGLRDLGMVLVEDAETVEATTGDTTVRVVGPADADPAVLDEVAAEAVTSVETLAAAFGPYPWTELDVVSTPLGSAVGGMEWPGMVWIEQDIFAGGLPGMGDLGDLVDLEDLEDTLGDLGLDDLGLDDLGLGLDPEVLGATRRWTLAHEVGHEWWHAVVGNDSIVAPVVDEPLAQYSACLVFQRAWAGEVDADAVCQGNTAATYEQMRTFGEEDAPAAQPSEDFTSSLQYGGIVYGKAPGVYGALGARFGEDAVAQALAGVVSDHAFQQISVDQLVATLGDRLGDPAQVDALWTRWIEQAHGDEDLGVDPSQLGGLGGLGDLGDLGDLDDLGLSESDLAALEELLEQLGLAG
jgi:hypothetical protein